VCTFITERVAQKWRDVYMFRKMDEGEVGVYEKYASAY
jgi:hypothetical protein